MDRYGNWRWVMATTNHQTHPAKAAPAMPTRTPSATRDGDGSAVPPTLAAAVGLAPRVVSTVGPGPIAPGMDTGGAMAEAAGAEAGGGGLGFCAPGTSGGMIDGPPAGRVGSPARVEPGVEGRCGATGIGASGDMVSGPTGAPARSAGPVEAARSFPARRARIDGRRRDVESRDGWAKENPPLDPLVVVGSSAPVGPASFAAPAERATIGGNAVPGSLA